MVEAELFHFSPRGHNLLLMSPWRGETPLSAPARSVSLVSQSQDESGHRPASKQIAAPVRAVPEFVLFFSAWRIYPVTLQAKLLTHRVAVVERGQCSFVLGDNEDDVAVLRQGFVVQQIEVFDVGFVAEQLPQVLKQPIDECHLGFAEGHLWLLLREFLQLCLHGPQQGSGGLEELRFFRARWDRVVVRHDYQTFSFAGGAALIFCPFGMS